MINDNTTGLDRKRRIHFYTLGGRPIGCTTKYNPTRQTAINSPEDYAESYPKSEVCKFCARYAAIPADWTLLAIHTMEESDMTEDAPQPQSDSSDDESCSSNDTASDLEDSIL